MSTAPTTRPSLPPAPRPGPAPAPAPAIPSLDPIKLFRKYQWVLAIASVVGIGVGIALHVGLLRYYPTFRATATFLCYGPQTSAGQIQGTEQGANRDEFDRFMATQALVIKSDTVLRRFVEDPRLEREAPKWTKQYYENGRFNPSLAMEGIKDALKARAIAGSQFIEMSMGWRDRNDVAAVVRLMREAYLGQLNAQVGSASSKQKESVSQTIRDLNRDLERLQSTKKQLITDGRMDSLDQRYNEAQSALTQLKEKSVQVRLDLESVRVTLENYEAELNSPSGANYPDELRSQIDVDPVMNGARNALSSMESTLKSLQQSGFGPQHREIVLLRAQIDGQKAQIEQLKQQLLADRFAAVIDGTRKAKAGLEAQLLDSETQAQQLQTRLVEITGLQTQIKDLDQQIEQVIASRSTAQDTLNNLQGIDRLDTAARVVTYQTESVPDQVAFPVIYITLPLGYMLVVGLVGAWIFLRELLDQRVKGPADIAMIPRTRLLGMIASTSEDPDAKSPETVFRDAPTSIVSENFRQLKSPLAKRMSNGSHKTLLVIGGMPGSGATSIVTNLSFAYASAEQRVLVIDANFRRPAIHKILGMNEAPGLSDVLARAKSLGEAIQPGRKPGEPDVLAAGTAQHRVFERLGANAMADVLKEAGERYDLVLIDVAPAVVSGDGLAIANRADASIFVVRALSEKRGLVARLKNELSESRAEFLGVVINGVRSSAGGYFKKNMRATQEYNRREGAPA